MVLSRGQKANHTEEGNEKFSKERDQKNKTIPHKVTFIAAVLVTLTISLLCVCINACVM